jgi:hypothetical protein
MVLTKILKRKDAASLIVAFVAALAIVSFLSSVTAEPASKLAGIGASASSEFVGPGNDWRLNYLTPTINFIFQLITLEVLARTTIALRSFYIKNSKK